MHEQQINGLVITDEMQSHKGIFTLRDLRRVIVMPMRLAPAHRELMTLNPFIASDSFCAALAMTSGILLPWPWCKMDA